MTPTTTDRLTLVVDLDAWTPHALDRLLDAIRNPAREERKFRRWEIRCQARARKNRRGWR